MARNRPNKVARLMGMIERLRNASSEALALAECCGANEESLAPLRDALDEATGFLTLHRWRLAAKKKTASCGLPP